MRADAIQVVDFDSREAKYTLQVVEFDRWHSGQTLQKSLQVVEFDTFSLVPLGGCGIPVTFRQLLGLFRKRMLTKQN